ncbi:MAG: DUF4446 family protein [Eubacterium sp.]|nr:DUF4446 family protein [Eubacterium sp.]
MSETHYIASIVGVVVLFLILYIRQSIKISRLMNRYEKFMRGKNAENLADALEENFQQMEELSIQHQKTQLKVEESLHSIVTTFHKLGIVKYDAFKEMGGNLSFALCLLDDNDTGFILNTMHGRESSYTYVKEIIKGEAYSTLGEEEKEALEKALNS